MRAASVLVDTRPAPPRPIRAAPLAVCLVLPFLPGCSPRLDSPDPAERSAAVASPRFNDQALLARIALEAEDVSVRNVAIQKLTDRALLERLAAAGRNDPLGSAAGTRLDHLNKEEEEQA